MNYEPKKLILFRSPVVTVAILIIVALVVIIIIIIIGAPAVVLIIGTAPVLASAGVRIGAVLNTVKVNVLLKFQLPAR